METKIPTINQYLKSMPSVDKEKLLKINEIISQSLLGSFKVEEIPLKQLKIQKAVYTWPQISPEFLRLSSQKPIDIDSSIDIISVPRFGVYSIDNPNMVINFGDFVEYYGLSSINGAFFGIEEPEGLPSVLEYELVKGNELFADSQGAKFDIYQVRGNRCCVRGIRSISKELKEKYKSIGVLTIRSSFHGLIPPDTRKKIKEAQPVLENIYLVAETKPEEWSVEKHVPRFVRDPLVIGVLENKCFLVDKFDTTSLEDYISKEFTF